MTKLWFERTDIDDLVKEEGKRIYAKWGVQELPDFPGDILMDQVKKSIDHDLAYARKSKKEYPSWATVLQEEVVESIAESDNEKKKAELVQVMAVAKQWWDAIDRREKK